MIKWGLIGAGKMGRVFAESIKDVNNAKLIAVASLNNKTLELFGNDFKINENLRFNDYQAICENSEIDAIYISTLNNTHLNLIKMCAQGKKNILCEKPFCLNLNEAVDAAKVIKENNIKFFEAIAYISHPQTNGLMNLISTNEIGEIKSIESSYGFKVKIRPESRLFNKKLGGGAILDVGCYPLSFVSLFKDKKNQIEFKDIKGVICETNVDTAASAQLLINNKIICKIKVSLSEYFSNDSIIYGTKGKIVIRNPWSPKQKTFLEIFNNERSYKKFIDSDLTLYANQIENISNEFLGKDNDTLNLFDISKALENMKHLDHWRKNINI
tara:strand:+ start:817 stop:1797 length:981 start_codon:yes stop_codon:yes gene_type:complete